MANALEAASLIMIPSGYEDGTLGSLKPTDGSGDFTFSRGSNLSATRINEQGYIEKGYENLLLQSNSFLTTWTTSGTLTPNQTGYDGSTDAWLYEKSAAFQQIGQTISQGGVSTFSVYLKAGSYEWVRLRISNLENAYYQLTGDGSLGTIAGGAISAKIDSVGNGWYRCSISVNSTISDVKIYPVLGDNDMGTSGSIYIQDAMLNQGLVAYPYIETTTAPVAGGILEDEPRIDFSDGCGHLLLEPSRTNLIKYSEYFSNYPWTTNSSLTSNYGVSPEGVQNSTRVEFSGSSKYLVYPFGGNPVYGSIYVKGTNGETINFGAGNVAGGGLFTLNGDWQRIGFYNDGTAAYYSINTYNGATARDIEIYGAQLEQDATYPTSYIPTYGVSQTRLGDILFEGATGFSNFFNATEGTLFFEVDEPLFRQLTIDGRSIALRDTTNGEYFQLRGRSNSVYFLLTMCSPSVVSIGNIENNTKYAIKWNGSEIKIFTDGAARGSSTQIDSFRPYTLGVASGFGMYTPTGEKFNNITFFPTALSDSECIALTTI